MAGHHVYESKYAQVTRKQVMVRPTSRIIEVCAVLTAIPLAGSYAQSDSRPIPYPVVVTPGFQRAIDAGTRTTIGEPGPEYWQQWTDYDIRARILPLQKQLEGSVSITYHNRSPDALPFVALHLLQNLHADGAIRNRRNEVTGGVELRRVMLSGQELRPRRTRRESGYTVNGTILRIYLPTPIQPGSKVDFTIEWAFTVPQAGASARMGWSRDNMFHIAYWYPQMAVYDDVDGWQTDQFLGGAEFYSGFGDYDLAIEAPPGWVIMGTGRLENPEEVFPDPVLQRYQRAHSSDEVVHVLTEEDLGPGTATRESARGFLTWRFHADSVRDVAFSATSASRWDAARTPVGDRDGDGTTDYALINTFWRTDAPRWASSWRYAQHSIDFLSRWTGYPYPWPHMTAVEGGGIIGGGMEFPMMTLIGDYKSRSDSALYYVHAHELGHMWLPMIVNIDEKRYAWMDEGTTTFNENQARKEFFPGLNHDEPDRESYLDVARAEDEGPMMRRSDFHYPGPAYSTASYSKPATVLVALRGLLGEEVFLQAFRTYIATWAFKNPKPWDFFNAVEQVSGRDLDWFWRAWYYETWTLDQAVASVTADDDATTIEIADNGWIPMPTLVSVTLATGDVVTREIPVTAWLEGNTRMEVQVAGTEVVRVEIDAAQAFPDIDRSNNVWQKEQG